MQYIPSNFTTNYNTNDHSQMNHYLNHAQNSLQSLKKVDATNFCYDDVAKCINTLERFYKAFLWQAHEQCEFYQYPSAKFLTDHDLLKLMLEIKKNFPDVLPRYNRMDWRNIKHFLLELKIEYNSCRYYSYPDYQLFSAIFHFTNQQAKCISKYLEQNKLKNYCDDYLEDYSYNS